LTERQKLPALTAGELEITTLPPGFDPGGFFCIEPELCAYLLDGDAARDHDARVTRTYIVRLKEDGTLVAYFTLLNDAIKLETHERPAGLPYISAPAIKVGRLAVDGRFSGRKVGDVILSYIVGLGRSLGEQIGIRYVTLDALPRPKLIGFYEAFGFVRNVTPATPEDGIGVAEEVSMRFDLLG
jgi:GNAT superfamily N-acetyltransferase